MVMKWRRTKSWNKALFFLTLLFCVLRAPSGSAAVSIDQAYQAALKKSEGVEIYKSQAEQAKERINQAESRFLPTLSAIGTYQKFDKNGTIDRPDQTIGRLNATQSLFEGGRDRANYKLRESDRKSRDLSLLSAKNELYTQVANAFYNVMAAEQDVFNLKKSIDAANERIADLRGRTKIGRSRNVEVLAAQSQLAVYQGQLAAAQGALYTARSQFAYITGMSTGEVLADSTQLPDTLPPLTEFINGLEKRPDVQALKLQEELYKFNTDVLRSGHWPSLSLNGNYYLTRNDTYPDSKWDFGVALTFPLYAGGLVQSQVREAKEREYEASVATRLKLRETETGVREFYDNYLSLMSQSKTLADAVKTTEQSYRELVKDYRYGLTTNLEVLQALATFQDTKRNLDKAHYQALIAWAALQTAKRQLTTEAP